MMPGLGCGAHLDTVLGGSGRAATLCIAGFPACGFTGHPCRVFPWFETGGWEAARTRSRDGCATWLRCENSGAQRSVGAAESFVCPRFDHAPSARCAGRRSRSATLSTGHGHFGYMTESLHGVTRPTCAGWPRSGEGLTSSPWGRAMRQASCAEVLPVIYFPTWEWPAR